MVGRTGRTGTSPGTAAAAKLSARGAHNENKRTKDQVQIDRARMVKWLEQGYSKVTIARELGVSPSQITYDWNKVLKEMNEHRDTDAMFLVTQELMKLEDVYREAREAWELSKQEFVRRVEEEMLRAPKMKVDDKGKLVPDGEATMQKVKEVLTREGRLPDPKYLAIMLECHKRQCELQSLNPTKQVEIKGRMDVVQWEALSIPPADANVKNEVEMEIARVLAEMSGRQTQSTTIDTTPGQSQGHTLALDNNVIEVQAIKEKDDGE